MGLAVGAVTCVIHVVLGLAGHNGSVVNVVVVIVAGGDVVFPINCSVMWLMVDTADTTVDRHGAMTILVGSLARERDFNNFIAFVVAVTVASKN